MIALELAWTLIALDSMRLAYLNGVESHRDFQALGGSTNGRRTIAVGNLRREIVRGLIAVAWVAIGTVALLSPGGGFSPIGVVLVLTAAGMNLNSRLDRRDRLYLLKYGLAARDDKGRFTRVETQNQREDRQFGEERRSLEQEHLDNK